MLGLPKVEENKYNLLVMKAFHVIFGDQKP